MEKNTLKRLLEKYYRGETTVEEEILLQHYFSGTEKTSLEIETDSLLIRNSQTLKEKQKATSGIEDRLSSFMDEKLSDSFVDRFRRTFNRYAVAASYLLLVGTAAFFVFRNTGNKLTDTYSDPQLAYLEAEKTLMFVSEKINLGMQPLSNIEAMNTGTRPLKSLEKMEENLAIFGFFTFVNQSSSIK